MSGKNRACRGLVNDTDTVLYFPATQEARHRALLQANAQARVLVDQARADEAPGRRLRLVIGIDHEDITIKQRGFFHAAVLPQIAEQYRTPDGIRYVAAVWKEFFRKRFLPDRWVMHAVPRWDAVRGVMVPPKRATPMRVRSSTEDLNIRQYSLHIDRVIAAAVTELGVAFEFDAEEREAVRFKAPQRRARQPVQEGAAA